jgi:hypothetical protein
VQLTAVPDWHPAATLHVSTPLHQAPSLQKASFAACPHESVASLQASVVQETASAQLGAVPAWHPAAGLHVSAPLHQAPSLQTESCGALTHESVASLQESAVQETPSEQLFAEPPQTPAVQTSPTVQYCPSLQVVPSSLFPVTLLSTHWVLPAVYAHPEPPQE